MPVKIKPLTKKELLACFQDYRQAFPDWAVEHDVVLVRSQGPLKQHIAFEGLRDGAYRPSCSVEILVTPGVRILPRFLDVKHREVLPRNHLTKWPQIVKAMEEQFLPSIRRSLDVAEVLQLEEEEVVRDGIYNVNHFSALAALNAYVGGTERARFWCDRVPEQLKTQGRPPAGWELRQEQFTKELREAINLGQQQSFLSTVLHQQS